MQETMRNVDITGLDLLFDALQTFGFLLHLLFLCVRRRSCQLMLLGSESVRSTTGWPGMTIHLT